MSLLREDLAWMATRLLLAVASLISATAVILGIQFCLSGGYSPILKNRSTGRSLQDLAVKPAMSEECLDKCLAAQTPWHTVGTPTYENDEGNL